MSEHPHDDDLDIEGPNESAPGSFDDPENLDLEGLEDDDSYDDDDAA